MTRKHSHAIKFNEEMHTLDVNLFISLFNNIHSDVVYKINWNSLSCFNYTSDILHL